MTDTSNLIPPLTPEEIAETIAAADEFMTRINAVPESGRIPMRSDRFGGPVGAPDAT